MTDTVELPAARFAELVAPAVSRAFVPGALIMALLGVSPGVSRNSTMINAGGGHAPARKIVARSARLMCPAAP